MTTLSTSVINGTIEEIEAAVVEMSKSVREYQIQLYWQTGEILRRTEKSSKIGVTELVQACVQDPRMQRLNMAERSLWFAIQLHDRYPVFEDVYQTEHGLSISVSKLKTMIAGKEATKEEPTEEEIAQAFIKKHGHDKAHRIANIIIHS
jgi:hypothetical protein